jgi:NAD+ synthase (glutamine-hydrolysing)
MRMLHVATAALNQTPLAWDSNQAHILAAIKTARAAGAQVLCLPELSITGYGCEDAFQAIGVQQTALEVLHEITSHTQGMIVAVGLPVMAGGGLYNMAALLVDGNLAGLVGKQNLAGEGVHYEPRWFKPWPAGVKTELEINGQMIPVGDLLFECDGIRLGFEICEDAWVGTRPGAKLARGGADILLNPSASHFAFGKQEIRRRFVQEGSRAFGVGYLYANLLGNEAGRVIYDGGTMIAAGGTMLAEGKRFSFEDHVVTTAVLDIDANRMNRARVDSYRPDPEQRDIHQIDVPIKLANAALGTEQPQRATWETGGSTKEEEFARVISLGLFDYMRKSRSRGFVISLSGGADSTAVATLSALAIRRACSELGYRRAAEKLGYLPAIGDISNVDDLIKHLLVCVYQATCNSSQETTAAAQTVAKAVGAEFMYFQVDDVVDSYKSMVARAIGRELTWKTDDLALQNIQARSRAPSVWLLANLRGALLLSTSNRSEAAVGYATMDGDTCGGLSPIAGIDKAFLRHWLRWMETDGPDQYGPIPDLRVVNQLVPTAELRPQESKQTDEEDLMPYEVLDAIERLAIRDKKVPLEVYQLLLASTPAFESQQLLLWIDRFFRLWCRNQWKRERYAPCFHLDDENLDPKTWCRFPILSGGFERELRQLREYVQQQENNS